MKGFIDPALDRTDGLEILYAYHDSFVLQGKRLLALWEDICKHGIDEDRAAQSIELVDYYTGATRLHHLDEERCLFPRIINKSFRIDGMVERLALDHAEIEARWAEFVDYLRASEGTPRSSKIGPSPGLKQFPGQALDPLRVADPARCLALAHQFEQQLRAHIERENLDFFPELEKLLSLEQRMEIGGQMAHWRIQIGLITYAEHKIAID